MMSSDHEVDIFVFLSASEKSYMRKLIIRAILGTDMSQHFALADKFKQFVKDTINQTEGKAYSIENDEHRIDLITILIHTMDVSSTSCMDFDISHPWGLRCAQEFND